MKVAEWKFTGKAVGKGKSAVDSSADLPRPFDPRSAARSYMDVLKGTETVPPETDPDATDRKGGSSDGTPPKTLVQPKLVQPKNGNGKRSKGQKQQLLIDDAKHSESTHVKSAESSTGVSSSASSVALSPDAVGATIPELHQVYRVHNWNVTAKPFEPKPETQYYDQPSAQTSWNGWWNANQWQETWEPADMWEQAWTSVKMADGKIFAAREPLKETSANRVAAEGRGGLAAELRVATVADAENAPDASAA
jgi:hypothetical protein